MRNLAVVVMTAAVLTGCAAPRRPMTLADVCRLDADSSCAGFTRRIDALRWVETADPEADARRAIGTGNPPLLAVWDYASKIPGVPGVVEGPACRVVHLEGTGDYHIAETLQLQNAAIRYAQVYNRLVLPHTGCAPSSR